MDFEIFALGDPAFLAETLKATTTIMARDGLSGIVSIGFLIAFLWVVIQGVLAGGSEIKIQNILFAGIVYFAFFGVTVERVNVWSQTTMEFHQVEDVPLGLAFTGTVISKVGNNLSEWFEQEYTIIGIPSSSMGTGFALKALYEMRGLGFSDGSLKWDPNGHLTKSLDNYINDCVVPGTTLPTPDASGQPNGLPAISLKKVVESDSAWDHLKWDNWIYTTKVYPYLTTDPTSSDVSKVLVCSKAYDHITTEFTNNSDVINNWIGNVGKATCNEAGYSCAAWKTPAGEFNTSAWANSFNTMRDAIMTADVELDKLLINRSLLLPLSNLKATELGTGDALLSAVTQRASAQITANQALQQTMFEKMMLPLMTFFEALMYVAGPFAAILVAFGVGGIGMIGKYLVFALWVQLWKPVAAVGNMFIAMSVSGEMSSLSDFAIDEGSSLSALANQPEVFDALQHWIGVGGMLVASTPAITLMLMYGSAVTASSLASRIDMGKSANVGMDDFTGKSQVGDAKRSLTDAGNIAAGNDQTGDATMGSVSMSGTANRAAQQATAEAASHSQQATTQRGKALQQATAAGVSVANQNVSGRSMNGEEMGSKTWADSVADNLVQSGSIEQTDRSDVSTALNAKASGGINPGALMNRFKQNGINTGAMKGAGAGKWAMVMSMMKGEVGAGAEYQDRFNQAAAKADKLMESVNQGWSNAESGGYGWKISETASDQDTLTQTDEWKNSETATQQALESDTKARSAEQRASTLQSIAGSSGYQQRFELATLTADAANQQSMNQFGQFLEAKQQQGDAAYAGMTGNTGDYMRAVQHASANGKTGDMAELLSIGGQQVDDPFPKATAAGLMQGMLNSTGGPQLGPGGAPTTGQVGPPLTSDGKLDLNSMDASEMAQAVADNPHLERSEMTPEQAEQFLQDSGLGEGGFQGETSDADVQATKDNAFADSPIREVGGRGKDLMDFLDTGILQQMSEQSGNFSNAGAAAGGAAGAVKAGLTAHALKQSGKSIAMGMLRGAAGGVFRGGAYGAIIGAAVGAVQGYNAYKDTVDEGMREQAGKELQGAMKGGNFTQISEASQEVINETLQGVVGKQIEAMDRDGENFDIDSFRNELTDFEREVYDSGDTLMGAGQVRSDGSSYGDGLGESMAELIDKENEQRENLEQIQRR